jgi:hypothetical protein
LGRFLETSFALDYHARRARHNRCGSVRLYLSLDSISTEVNE